MVSFKKGSSEFQKNFSKKKKQKEKLRSSSPSRRLNFN